MNRRRLTQYLTFLLVLAGLYACASQGQPDGGPYDETPPKFVRANPEPGPSTTSARKSPSNSMNTSNWRKLLKR